ncbi:Non-repetitive/WGA-negative nucleoporin C-terminal-domain-containing protein [Phlyctochytrium arcticum]|nr:Non-repetitive/WGA-negative nucleoporin C-terminal-domain-containing protein [Phlyctochytrium arcticum]
MSFASGADRVSDGWGGLAGSPSQTRRQHTSPPPQQSQQQPAVQKQDRLRIAANAVNEQLEKDRFPDLWDLLAHPQDEKYREQEQVRGDALKFLRSDQFVSLPSFIYEEYDNVVCKTFMGFLSEINRVWITMDSRLYLWNPSDKDPKATKIYAEQDQIICSVGIVKPPTGIFLEQIEYVLVLATALEVIVVGLTFAKRGDYTSEMTMYATDLKVPVDGITVTDILGTDEGRIFMRGNRGQLLELQYQATDGWFTRKIRLVNHSASTASLFLPSFLPVGGECIRKIFFDKERHILYTVSSTNDLQLIYLGEDGKKFQRIKTLRDPISEAFGGTDERIVIQGVYPITAAESAMMQAVAVTSRGDRIFFSIYAYPVTGPGQQMVTNTKPDTLRFVYSLSANRRSRTVGNAVHESLYSRGLLIAADAVSAETDRIFGIELDVGLMAQANPKFWLDSISYEDLAGKVWQISEVQNKQSYSPSFVQPGSVLNELSLQMEYPARTFRLLTNQGICHMTKLRPIDQFAEMLYQSDNDRAPELEKFLNTYGSAEACSMCLAVACEHPSTIKAISDYGGNAPQQVIPAASRLFERFGGQPYISQPPVQGMPFDRNNPMGYAMAAPEIRFSGKYNGLSLYLARLLKPIWKERIVTRKGKDIVPSATSKGLNSVRSNLISLNGWLAQRKSLTALPAPDNRPPSVLSEAWKAEQESMFNLHEILRLSQETLAMLSILFDEGISQLANSIPIERQQDLENITYEELITTLRGLDVTRALMAAFIDKQIAEEKSVYSVGQELQNACPSICLQNDVILYSGIECIHAARNLPNQDLQNEKLRESLSLFKQVVRDITFQKLQDLTEQYKMFNHYDEIVELVMSWAAAQEPTDDLRASTRFASNGRLNEDSPTFQRKKAYDIILQAVNNLHYQLQHPRANVGMSSDEIAYRLDRILSQSLQYDDPLFHDTLYEWFISEGMEDKLLTLNTRYLEDFFRRNATDPSKATLLAKFYIKKERYYDAAQVYRSISEMPGLTFPERMENLSLALVQAKLSTTGGVSRIIDRPELEELQDIHAVANVQQEILKSLQAQPNPLVPAEGIQELHERFMTVTELFNNYARPCHMYEIQLEAVYVSDGNAQKRHYAQNAWMEIIKRTREEAAKGRRDPFAALAEKIRELGSKFYPDDNVFPLQFLIDKMEQESYNAAESDIGPEHGWIVNALRAIKVPYSEIFQVYNAMFESKLPPWSSTKALIYLLEDITVLINEWLRFQAPEDVPRRALDDAIDRYLVTIHDGGEARDLVRRLHILAVRVRQEI